MFWTAFLVFGIAGCLSVLLDLDHLIPFKYTGVSVWDFRPLHRPIAILCCIVLCIVIAYIGRQIYRMVLNK